MSEISDKFDTCKTTCIKKLKDFLAEQRISIWAEHANFVNVYCADCMCCHEIKLDDIEYP